MTNSAESSGSDTSWNDASGRLYVNNYHEVAANHSLEQTRDSAGFQCVWINFKPEIIQFPSVIKAQGSQKPPDIIERFELWTVLDETRTAYPMILM